MMTSTLSRSISSCALVLAPAGLPPVSADDQLDLAAGERVALLLEERGDALLHLDAALRERAGLDGSSPTLNGAPWACTAGMLEVATPAPVASIPLNTVLRLTVMASTPCYSRFIKWQRLARSARPALRTEAQQFGSVAAQDRDLVIVAQCWGFKDEVHSRIRRRIRKIRPNHQLACANLRNQMTHTFWTKHHSVVVEAAGGSRTASF